MVWVLDCFFYSSFKGCPPLVAGRDGGFLLSFARVHLRMRRLCGVLPFLDRCIRFERSTILRVVHPSRFEQFTQLALCTFSEGVPVLFLFDLVAHGDLPLSPCPSYISHVELCRNLFSGRRCSSRCPFLTARIDPPSLALALDGRYAGWPSQKWPAFASSNLSRMPPEYFMRFRFLDPLDLLPSFRLPPT